MPWSSVTSCFRKKNLTCRTFPHIYIRIFLFSHRMAEAPLWGNQSWPNLPRRSGWRRSASNRSRKTRAPYIWILNKNNFNFFCGKTLDVFHLFHERLLPVPRRPLLADGEEAATDHFLERKSFYRESGGIKISQSFFSFFSELRSSMEAQCGVNNWVPPSTLDDVGG